MMTPMSTTASQELTVEKPTTGSPALRLAALLRRMNRVDTIALAAIIVIGGIIVLTNLTGAPAYQDDEGTYAAQAISVQNGELAPYTYWYDHPPFGWIQLAILAWIPQLFGLGGGTDVGMIRYVMAFYFLATAALIYLLARRVQITPLLALTASAIFIVSPLSLELGRQAFLDSVALPWTLLAFYLALSPRLSLWSHAGAGASFAIAALSKLTALVMGPALLLAIFDRKAWLGRSFSVVGFLTVGALVLVNFPLMAAIRGELTTGEGHVSLEDGLRFQFESRAGSGSFWEASSTRQDIVLGWVGADGFLIVAGCIAAIVCLASRRTRWLTFAVLCFAMPILVGSGYLPRMYVIAGIPFLCLAIAAAADLVFRGVHRVTERFFPGNALVRLVVLVSVLALVLAPMPLSKWVEKDGVLLTANQNAEWQKTLEWMQANVDRNDVVLTPYSMWQDLNSSGWNDNWTMIALEKADLDSKEYRLNHPRGWKEIQWVVEGPTVQPNLHNLSLAEANSAFEHSEVVESFGPWHVRRVIP